MELIERQAAIDAVKGLPTWWADEGGYYGDAQPPMTALLNPEDVVSALENLTPVQPQRMKGRWLPDNNCAYEMRFVCSVCKESEVVPTIGFMKYKPIWDFCPNCGADMKYPENPDS